MYKRQDHNNGAESDHRSKAAKLIKIDSDVLPQSSASINSNESCSDANTSCGLDSVQSQTKLSCWGDIDPVWKGNAYQPEDDRFYVHQEILEWIIQYIDENILNENLRADVEEVHHHNLDGPIYIIKFYKTKSKFRRMKCEMPKTVHEGIGVIKKIRDRLKYKMAWKPIPTYFLRMDSLFEDRKICIMNQLQELNLHNCFTVTSLDVNWLYIPKIEIYEIFEYLPEERLDQIDLIFREMSESRASIYICNQFKWHQEISEVDVDKVAMDMCIEEWIRHDLLKDFSVQDILRLDLANKDYRDSYCNEYLDRYLDRLLMKVLSQHSTDHEGKLEFPLYRLYPDYRHYFVSRFYKKISILCDDDGFVDELNAYDIPIIERLSETVELIENQPHPDTVLMIHCHSIQYKILNYNHFSDSLLRALLNKSVEFQKYKIQFDEDFNFNYESNQQFSPHLLNDCNWTFGEKYIVIKLKDCTEENADKLVKFVKYLINLFAARKKLDVKVAMCFINCALEDYSFLENIGNSIDDIQFKGMSITSRQIEILSRALTQITRSVTFTDCKDITDHNVMTLLENIDWDLLWIEGENSCTPNIYYLMAEYLMVKEGIDTIKANRFNGTMKDCNYNFQYNFDLIDFFKVGDQIVARNRHSKNTVDLYYLLNRINEKESIDPSNAMYIE